MTNMSDFNPPKGTVNTALRWISVAVVIIAALAIAGYFLGWFISPLDLTSPENVRRLSREANEHYAALESSRASIGTIESKMQTMVTTYGEDRSTWPQGKADEYLQLDAQRVNRIDAYNKLCASYKGKWNDEWFDLPAPDDLPKSCDLIQ